MSLLENCKHAVSDAVLRMEYSRKLNPDNQVFNVRYIEKYSGVNVKKIRERFRQWREETLPQGIYRYYFSAQNANDIIKYFRTIESGGYSLFPRHLQAPNQKTEPHYTKKSFSLPEKMQNGTIENINGIDQIFFDNYWIRYYEPPPESLSEKKNLLDALTKRTFHHTEPGINTPGEKLDEVRRAYNLEKSPKCRRINAAMLAGALFNRATDIFTTIVELEERGIHITDDDDLMQQCSSCLSEALSLCGNVKHYSGEEGIDELWGEPVKVFTMSIADYYCSRYRKIAQAMREIDRVGETIKQTICHLKWFDGAGELVDDFILIAKNESEVLRSDPDYLKIWPEFVADGEKILEFRARIPASASNAMERHIKRGIRLLRAGKDLITWIANVRVPMPVSTQSYLEKCASYRRNTTKFLN